MTKLLLSFGLVVGVGFGFKLGVLDINCGAIRGSNSGVWEGSDRPLMGRSMLRPRVLVREVNGYTNRVGCIRDRFKDSRNMGLENLRSRYMVLCSRVWVQCFRVSVLV